MFMNIPPYSQRNILLGMCCIFAFFVIGTLVRDNTGFLFALDTAVRNFFISIHSPSLTGFMRWITTFGDGTPIYLTYGVGLFILAVLRQWKTATGMAIGIWIMNFLTVTMKEFFERGRPADWLSDAGGWSYPSGHTTMTMILYIFIAYAIFKHMKAGYVRNILVTLPLAFALLVGISRIYLSVHWLSDVYGGILLSSGIFFIIVGLFSLPCFAKKK